MYRVVGHVTHAHQVVHVIETGVLVLDVPRGDWVDVVDDDLSEDRVAVETHVHAVVSNDDCVTDRFPPARSVEGLVEVSLPTVGLFTDVAVSERQIPKPIQVLVDHREP